VAALAQSVGDDPPHPSESEYTDFHVSTSPAPVSRVCDSLLPRENIMINNLECGPSDVILFVENTVRGLFTARKTPDCARFSGTMVNLYV
jgi:hypothetical protein